MAQHHDVTGKVDEKFTKGMKRIGDYMARNMGIAAMKAQFEKWDNILYTQQCTLLPTEYTEISGAAFAVKFRYYLKIDDIMEDKEVVTLEGHFNSKGELIKIYLPY
jgi:hypothetical protein